MHEGKLGNPHCKLSVQETMHEGNPLCKLTVQETGSVSFFPP